MAPVASLAMLFATTGCESPVDLGPVADAHSVADIRAALGGGAHAAASGGAAAAGAAATGTGWGTIKGRFVYDGAPPKMAPYDVSKDQATCAPGGGARRRGLSAARSRLSRRLAW